jgi:hypothetical protein
MNAAARIQEACRNTDNRVLASAGLRIPMKAAGDSD